MKYGLRCPVTSKIRLSKPETRAWDDLTLELKTNPEGYLAHVSVSASGEDAAEYHSGTHIDHSRRTIKVQVNRNEKLHARMKLALQSLESFLCFYGNLEAIHWDAAEAFVEAEAEEEKKDLGIQSWMIAPGINDPIVNLSPEQLDTIVAHASRCSEMTATLAFHRMGINNVRRFQYISAFFNFYFVLEGLYGNGKFRAEHVKNEFGRSATLVSVIEKMIAA